MDIVGIISDALQLVILFTTCHNHQYGRWVEGPSMERDLAFVVLVFKILMGHSITKGRERPPSASILEGTFVEEDGAKQ
jgi:hypothetical protein